jgi:hypothetical protein
LIGKFNRRVRDKQLVLITDIGTVTGFPKDLDFRMVVSRIRFKE